MEPRPTTDVQVLDRAVAVLEALEAGPHSLVDLVRATGLARATTHRLATALELHGLVRRDASGRWLLGPAIGRMAAAAGGSSLAVLAVPVLEELRDATGESVQLYVRRGHERVCVVSLESPHSLRTIVPVGAVLPLDRGSAGRVLAGAGVGTPAKGWVESVEEREAGVASVSAPVFDRRPAGPDRGAEFGERVSLPVDSMTVRIAGAVSVSGPVERTSRAPGARYGDAVCTAARHLEVAAGYAAR